MENGLACSGRTVVHDQLDLTRIVFGERRFGKVRYGVRAQIAGYVTNLLREDILSAFFRNMWPHFEDLFRIEVSRRWIERWEQRDAFREGDAPLQVMIADFSGCSAPHVVQSKEEVVRRTSAFRGDGKTLLVGLQRLGTQTKGIVQDKHRGNDPHFVRQPDVLLNDPQIVVCLEVLRVGPNGGLDVADGRCRLSLHGIEQSQIA